MDTYHDGVYGGSEFDYRSRTGGYATTGGYMVDPGVLFLRRHIMRCARFYAPKVAQS